MLPPNVKPLINNGPILENKEEVKPPEAMATVAPIG